jgi:AAA15 family ATPase/GTPase
MLLQFTYGPNAGGKSNFIDAMAQFRGIVLSSSKESQQGELLPVTPFCLHAKSLRTRLPSSKWYSFKARPAIGTRRRR